MAVVALEASEAYLVAGVAIDLAVAIDHPTQDNWVTVGGDVLAIATGYVVGKVIIGPALKALQKGARQLLEREAAETVVLLPKTGQAAEEAIAAEQVLARAKAAKIAAHKARQASPEAQAEQAAKEARKQRGAEKKSRQDEQKAQADAAKRQVPVEPSRTQPSRAPNPEAKPGGRRAKVEGNAKKQQSIQRENEAADHAAKAGYKVEQQPDVPGSKNPDYRIEGKVFDCYAPQGDNLDTISKTMTKKVAGGQTRRLVINLDDAPGTSVQDIANLSRTVKASSAPELEEVLVWKNGQFHHVYP